MKTVCPSCGSQRVWPDIRDGAIHYRCKDCHYSNSPQEWDRGPQITRRKTNEQRTDSKEKC